MSLGESFAALFQSANILTVCLWATGFVLFTAEFFQPMRGIAYTLGSTLLCASFVTQMLHGSPGEAFVFVLLTCFCLFAVHVVSLATQKRDWLNVARMERAGERSRKYGSLIDKIGVANTPIDLTGNATINDVNLVVCSQAPIAVGERVRIIEVTPDKIVVEKVDDNN